MKHYTVAAGSPAKLALVAVFGMLIGAGCAAAPNRTPVSSPTQSAAEPTASPAPTSTPTVVVGQPQDGLVGITYTLPASGWRTEDGVLYKGGEVLNVPEAAVLLWPFHAGSEFFVYGDPCRWTSTKPATPATTADEIVAAFATQASRQATAPVDVVIDGYAGKSITLHVPPDATFSDCDEGNFAAYGTAEDALSRYHQGPGQIDEFWVLDVDGAIVIIDAMYRVDTPAEIVEEMRSIARSATFETP